ncbi:MAG: matrixin family metalloprotease, partial [Dethiobacteria bacterium]|nr:matrixin family metalloprotease [Dethiobacteria bacterium]
MRKYSIVISLVTILLVIAATLGIGNGNAQAVMLKMSLDDLTTEADSIVIGTVESAVSRWNEDRSAIYTTVTVLVEDDIKGGNSQNSVTIIVPGGEVDGITQTVSDTPAFETGEQAFFFLSDLPTTVLPRRQFSPKFYELQGNFQGKLIIEDDSVEGLPLGLFEEELQSILDEGEAKYYFETNPDEPTLTSYNQFVTLPFRWPSSSIPVSYWVNASSDRNAHVQAAANSWSSAGANFSFNYRGTHSRSGGASMNNKNEVMWNDLNTNTVLAVATIWTSNNTILEADMTFNTRFSWSTDGWYGYDVQTVALHEFGHWVGLDHTPLYESIMYYRIKGTQRNLHSSDIAGIRHIYSATTSTVTNDNFTSRTAISGTSGQATGSNINCTKEPGEPNHAGNSGGQSVWWEWVAPASGLVEISTAGSNFDTLLGVYSGTSVSGLTAVASNDDYGMTYQ